MGNYYKTFTRKHVIRPILHNFTLSLQMHISRIFFVDSYFFETTSSEITTFNKHKS